MVRRVLLPLELVFRAMAARRADRIDADAERQLEAAFGCSRRLAVYGTLAPGAANAHELADCRGRWTSGHVSGRRGERVFPVFTFDPAAPPVPVEVFDSGDLPACWQRLDAFEGDGYRRILVPVAWGDGRTTVANLYEAVVPVAP